MGCAWAAVGECGRLCVGYIMMYVGDTWMPRGSSLQGCTTSTTDIADR